MTRAQVHEASLALVRVLERDWRGYTSSGLGQWLAWAEELDDALAMADAVFIARLARKRLIVRGTLS